MGGYNPMDKRAKVTLEHKLAKMRRHIAKTGDLKARIRYNELVGKKYYREDK